MLSPLLPKGVKHTTVGTAAPGVPVLVGAHTVVVLPACQTLDGGMALAVLVRELGRGRLVDAEDLEPARGRALERHVLVALAPLLCLVRALGAALRDPMKSTTGPGVVATQAHVVLGPILVSAVAVPAEFLRATSLETTASDLVPCLFGP